MTQNAKYGCLPKIGSRAPDFSGDGTYGQVSLSDFNGRWLVFFSHPSDFTPVCATEMLAFARAYPEFEEMDCDLLGLSVDSIPAHLAWMENIRKNTGVILPFAIISDPKGDIARRYGMTSPEESKNATTRTLFIIDPEQNVRAALNYPISAGRSVEEVKRLLCAIQTGDASGAVTPADWKKGDAVMKKEPGNYQTILSEGADGSNGAAGGYRLDWYMCFCDLPE